MNDLSKATPAERITHWAAQFQPLVGRTIKTARYLTPQEAANCGWRHSTLVLELDDGTLLFPSSDDEGNDAGNLFIQPGRKTQGMPDGTPVIRL
jgi:hypothetical protein